MLLEKGADPLIPCGHAYPGHLAMKHQSKGCLKLLMDHDIGAVMVKDKKYKGSLLHWAKNSDVRVTVNLPFRKFSQEI